MTEFRWHWVVSVLVAAISLPLAWTPLLQALSLAAHDDQYTHILLVLPLAAVLLYVERKSLQSGCGWGPSAGLAILAIAGGTAVAARSFHNALASDALLALEAFAVVLWWIGSFVLGFGRRVAQTFSFFFLLLFGLVPLPAVILDRIVAFLQIGSAWSARALFAICGVPVVQHGVLVTIPNLTIQVAQECSSIRSSSMLFVTTIVVAEMVLRSSWRKALLIALAIPLSVAKNGLRIFTIAMLGTRVDPGYLTGSLHRQGGIIFFAIAVTGVFVVLAILQRSETKNVHSNLQRPSTAATGD